MKKFSCITLICLTCIFSFSAPICSSVSYSYAATIPEGWTQATSNADLVSAFKAYCKSRNLAIDGSVADAVTSFTTQTFNNICNTLGIDVTALQAEIASRTDSNVGLQWFFTDSGVSAYNRIFAEFLQNNNLSVGDSANENNNTVYDGYYYNNSLIYIVDTSNGNVTGSIYPNSHILQHGSYYQFNNNQLISNLNNTLTLTANNYTWDITVSYENGTQSSTGYIADNLYGVLDQNSPSKIDSTLAFKGTLSRGTIWSYSYNYGFPCIVYSINTNTFYLCFYRNYVSNDLIYEGIRQFRSIGSVEDAQNTNIYITTNNTTINNNTYEGDTIINNNGDQGSGGGGNNPITPPSNGNSGTGEGSGGTGSDGTITIPDFNFDFPSINWSLGDLSQKFPFSIPFDLVAFFTVLNAEPEAPMIDANIPLGSFYTWHFVADFSQFDNYAVIIRNVEFLAFCIGLIYITIRLVKG